MISSISPHGRIFTVRDQDQQLFRLLQSVFAAELIQPSNVLYLFSPWITDVDVLDNQTGAFVSIAPEWERTMIPFSRVLRFLADRGTRIRIASRSADNRSYEFCETMRDHSIQVPGNVDVQVWPKLHEKGLLGDAFYLAGSFNFTYSGIYASNEELAYFTTAEEAIAQAHLRFHDRWSEKTK